MHRSHDTVLQFSLGLEELWEYFFLVFKSQQIRLWPSFLCYSVSGDVAYYCEKKREGGQGKREKDTIRSNHWFPFVMFVKPAGNAYPAGWEERRGCRDTIRDLRSPDRRDTGQRSHKHVSHSHLVWMCVGRGRGGDDRKSADGHVCVYYKLLFLLQVPVPQHFTSTGSCTATKAHSAGWCCYLAP